MAESAKAKFEKLAKNIEKLENGEFKEWVDFGDAGDNLANVIKWVFLPLTIVSKEVPDAVEKLLTAVDEMNALFAKLEAYKQKYVDMPLKLLIKTLRAILKLFNDIIDLILGGELLGGSISSTSVLAERHRLTKIPVAATLPSVLNTAFARWPKRPEGKKLYGFVFFPYFVPLLNTINKAAEAGDDLVQSSKKLYADCFKKGLVMKKRREDMAERYRAIGDTESYDQLEAARGEETNALVDAMLTFAKNGDVQKLIAKTLDATKEQAKQIALRQPEGVNPETDRSVLQGGTARGPVLLDKRAVFSARKDRLELKLNVDNMGEYWITSIHMGLTLKNGETVTDRIYANKYYEAAQYAMVYRDFILTMFDETSDLSYDGIDRFIFALLNIDGMFDLDTKTGEENPLAEMLLTGDPDVVDEVLADFLTLLMMREAVKEGLYLEGAEEKGSVYNSLSTDYRKIQRLRCKGRVEFSTIFRTPGATSPGTYTVTIPKSSEMAKLIVGMEGATPTLTVFLSTNIPYAIPDELIQKPEDELSDKDFFQIVDDYFDDYKDKYHMLFPKNTAMYTMPVQLNPSNFIVRGYRETDEHLDAHRWMGITMPNATLKQLLPKKAVKNIYKFRDVVNVSTELAIEELELAAEGLDDLMKVTDRIRGMVEKFIKDGLVAILEDLARAQALPSMGMVIGVIDGDASEIPDLIMETMRKTGVAEDVIGGLVLVGGVTILSTLLDYFRLIEAAVDKAKALKSEMESAFMKPSKSDKEEKEDENDKIEKTAESDKEIGDLQDVVVKDGVAYIPGYAEDGINASGLRNLIMQLEQVKDTIINKEVLLKNIVSKSSLLNPQQSGPIVNPTTGPSNPVSTTTNQSKRYN